MEERIPLTNPTKIYTSNKSREGQSSTVERSQITTDIQSEITAEQLVSSPQHSGPVIEQLNPLEKTTSFPEIQEERVVIPVRKEGIPTLTCPFKTRENPLRKPFYTNTNFEINPFSLLSNMADEEEGPRVENQDQPENDE